MSLRLNKGLTDTKNGDLNTGHPIDESERAAKRLRMNLRVNGHKKAIAEGKKFVIAQGSSKSRANKDGWVVKRVLLPESLGSNRKDVCVQLKVENVCDLWVE